MKSLYLATAVSLLTTLAQAEPNVILRVDAATVYKAEPGNATQPSALVYIHKSQVLTKKPLLDLLTTADLDKDTTISIHEARTLYESTLEQALATEIARSCSTKPCLSHQMYLLELKKCDDNLQRELRQNAKALPDQWQERGKAAKEYHKLCIQKVQQARCK